MIQYFTAFEYLRSAKLFGIWPQVGLDRSSAENVTYKVKRLH